MEIANREFSDYVIKELFSVQTAHATTYHDSVIKIPSLATFNAYGQTHKFHVFDFSEKYDGLIGLKLLEQLEAIIDIKNKCVQNLEIYQSTMKLRKY